MEGRSYTCLIVDDEPIAIRVLKKHLTEFKNLQLAGECNNAIEAMELLARTKIDLIFLDIQMPQITGIDFLKSLSNPPKVIFTTAYRDYAIDAFDLDVIDYLLKPISLLRFSKAINRFYQRMQETGETALPTTSPATKAFLFLKVDKKLHKVALSDIIYIESFGDYQIVHLEQARLTVKERISQLEEQLQSDLFMRVHRSFIVSIDKITALLPGQVELGPHKVPVGRSYKPLLDALRQNHNSAE